MPDQSKKKSYYKPRGAKMGRPRVRPWATTKDTNKSLQLHPDIHARLKHVAARTNIPMVKLVEQALNWLEREYSDLL